MKIAIESPQKLSDDDLENIVSVWNRKNRRLVVNNYIIINYYVCNPEISRGRGVGGKSPSLKAYASMCILILYQYLLIIGSVDSK